MTRICRSTDTVDGHECQQIIQVGVDHCESGHYTAPERNQTPRRMFSPVPKASSIGEVEDLLYPGRGEKKNDDKLEVDLPPWRLRTLAQSTIGAIALSGAPAVSGVTNVSVLAGLAFVGFVGPLINGIAQHTDDGRTAKADARDAQRTIWRELQLALITSSLSEMSAQFSAINQLTGKGQDQARGRLEGVVINGLVAALSEGANVALFRLSDQHFKFVLGNQGQTMPNSFALDSDIGQMIADEGSQGGSVLLPGGDANSDCVIAPVMAGNTLFGVIVAESARETKFDAVDVSLAGSYAKLAGVGLSMGRFFP